MYYDENYKRNDGSIKVDSEGNYEMCCVCGRAVTEIVWFKVLCCNKKGEKSKAHMAFPQSPAGVCKYAFSPRQLFYVCKKHAKEFVMVNTPKKFGWQNEEKILEHLLCFYQISELLRRRIKILRNEDKGLYAPDLKWELQYFSLLY